MPNNETDVGFFHFGTIILRFQLFAEPACNLFPSSQYGTHLECCRILSSTAPGIMKQSTLRRQNKKDAMENEKLALYQ